MLVDCECSLQSRLRWAPLEAAPELASDWLSGFLPWSPWECTPLLPRPLNCNTYTAHTLPKDCLVISTLVYLLRGQPNWTHLTLCYINDIYSHWTATVIMMMTRPRPLWEMMMVITAPTPEEHMTVITTAVHLCRTSVKTRQPWLTTSLLSSVIWPAWRWGWMLFLVSHISNGIVYCCGIKGTIKLVVLYYTIILYQHNSG